MDAPGPPYRDDRAALLDEIERLNAQLGRRKRRLAPALAGAFVLAHVVLREVLSGWLNGADDARFWCALVLVFTPLLAAAGALIAWARR